MSKCTICGNTTRNKKEFCEQCEEQIEQIYDDVFDKMVKSHNAPGIKVNKLMRKVFEKWHENNTDWLIQQFDENERH